MIAMHYAAYSAYYVDICKYAVRDNISISGGIIMLHGVHYTNDAPQSHDLATISGKWRYCHALHTCIDLVCIVGCIVRPNHWIPL